MKRFTKCVYAAALLALAACGDKDEVLRPADNEAVVGGVHYGLQREAWREPDGSYYFEASEASGATLFTFTAHVRMADGAIVADLAEWTPSVYYTIDFAMDAYCTFLQSNTAGGLYTTFNDVGTGSTPVFLAGSLQADVDADDVTLDVEGMLLNSDEFRLRLVVPADEVVPL